MFIKVLFLLSIMTPAFASHTYWGKKVAVGNGYARTYVTTSGNGKPIELGVAMSHGALSNLGMMDKEFMLGMPSGIQVPPYKHVSMNWNPHGHEPEHVYDLPHFDFHFYVISHAQQMSITCMGQDAEVCTHPVPDTRQIEGYAPTPGGVPKMGWHWVDTWSGEFHGQRFSRTFIYGYYNGLFAFVEPMITREFLLSKKTSVKTVRVPMQYDQDGYYPRSYKIRYDSASKLHKVSIKRFKYWHN